MILRVHAMWNQSKRIFYILLFIYLPQVIVTFVGEGIYNNPNTYLSGMSQVKVQAKLEFQMWPLPFSPVTVVQVVDIAFCNVSLNASSKILWESIALRLVLSAMLLILAVTSTLKESVMMYKATKKWQPNQYMQLFVKDGILYFLSYVSLLRASPLFQFITSYSLIHVTLNYVFVKKTDHYGLLGQQFTISLWPGSKMPLH